MTVVEYAVATGLDITADEASADLFPGCTVVLVGSDTYGQTRTWLFPRRATRRAAGSVAPIGCEP